MTAESLKLLSYPLLAFLFTGCQMGYLVKSTYHQVRILNQRIPIEEALTSNTISEEEKTKLRLSKEVREFAETKLNLNIKNNYTSYVKLDRPFVSYVLSASPRWKLESYLWSFPVIGKMPYKGYFSEQEATEEAEELKKKELDVYTRGVSAYSTLGWFKDPLLSSMLSYKEHDLVNTIIHESVHATLFIKSEADFNERMATFIGNKGMELFYLQKEGPKSKTLELVKKENDDEELFAKFITKELNQLEKWYQEVDEKKIGEDLRQQQFQKIKQRFDEEVRPKLNFPHWNPLQKGDLNNAKLVVYKTYMKDLNDFGQLFNLVNNNFSDFFSECKNLESSKNPTQQLKERLLQLKSSGK